ncbi:MAG: hypothetical protein ACRELZ_09505 [Candidatus Rokuibacteriota bacterium]
MPSEHSVMLARRTVAKYREALGIGCSSRRPPAPERSDVVRNGNEDRAHHHHHQHEVAASQVRVIP